MKRASGHAQSDSVDLSRTALVALGTLLHRFTPMAEQACDIASWLLPLLHRLLRQPPNQARRQLVRGLWCLEALLAAGHLPDSRPEPLCDLVSRLVRPEMSNAIQMRSVALVRCVAGSAMARSAGAAGVLVVWRRAIVWRWPRRARGSAPSCCPCSPAAT